MPRARRTDNPNDGPAPAPDPARSDDRPAGAPTLAGSGGTTAPMGQPTGDGDREFSQRVDELAREIAQNSHSGRTEARRRAIRRLARQGISGTYAEPEPTGAETVTAPTEDAPSFTTINNPSARRPYNRKPKVDPDAIALIKESVTVMINGLGTYIAGPDGEMNKNEQEQIVEPLARILQRMQPDTVKALQTLSDPVVLLLGGAMYTSRLMAIRRDSNNRRRPAPPPNPVAPPPSGATVEPTNGRGHIGEDGHLVTAYTGSEAI